MRWPPFFMMSLPSHATTAVGAGKRVHTCHPHALLIHHGVHTSWERQAAVGVPRRGRKAGKRGLAGGGRHGVHTPLKDVRPPVKDAAMRGARSVGLLLPLAWLVWGKHASVSLSESWFAPVLPAVRVTAALPVPQAPKAPTESADARTQTSALINWLEPVYACIPLEKCVAYCMPMALLLCVLCAQQSRLRSAGLRSQLPCGGLPAVDLGTLTVSVCALHGLIAVGSRRAGALRFWAPSPKLAAFFRA